MIRRVGRWFADERPTAEQMGRLPEMGEEQDVRAVPEGTGVLFWGLLALAAWISAGVVIGAALAVVAR